MSHADNYYLHFYYYNWYQSMLAFSPLFKVRIDIFFLPVSNHLYFKDLFYQFKAYHKIKYPVDFQKEIEMVNPLCPESMATVMYSLLI